MESAACLTMIPLRVTPRLGANIVVATGDLLAPRGTSLTARWTTACGLIKDMIRSPDHLHILVPGLLVARFTRTNILAYGTTRIDIIRVVPYLSLIHI